MNSNEKTSDLERGWILKNDVLVNDPRWKELADNYNIVGWTDFVENPEEYSDKIRVILQSSTLNLPLDEQVLEKLPNVRAVVNIGVGVDHLDIHLLRRLGIKVGVTLGAVTESTADMGFGLLMAAGRRMPEQMEAARGYEDGAKRNIGRIRACVGQDIHEATLGIVGMGKIGSAIARRAKGFRMNILYHNRNRRSKEDEEDVNATYCPTLEEMLPRVDFLMIAAPLTENTKNMMRKERFEFMKQTSILINISREAICGRRFIMVTGSANREANLLVHMNNTNAFKVIAEHKLPPADFLTRGRSQSRPLVNTDDLVDALRSGTIAGAAVDVTDPEPLPDHHPLLHLPNAIVLPHVGGMTIGAIRKVLEKTVANVRAAMEGRRMPGELAD